jgi:hypothetical protein
VLFHSGVCLHAIVRCIHMPVDERAIWRRELEEPIFFGRYSSFPPRQTPPGSVNAYARTLYRSRFGGCAACRRVQGGKGASSVKKIPVPSVAAGGCRLAFIFFSPT